MAKSPSQLFRCSNEVCDYASPRRFGICPQCHDGLGEEGPAPRSERAGVAIPHGSSPPAAIIDLKDVTGTTHERFTTGLTELDRVLGGGLVPGSYIILAGEPGAGKTTLSTQAIVKMAEAGRKILVVSGEESVEQARMRFDRLNAKFGQYPLSMTVELSVERVVTSIEAGGYDFVVVDSIQTMMSEGHTGRPGSVGQVSECAEKLRRVAKETGTSILLVGQVIKDGDMAGPRMLEHMVDVVMQFEGDRDDQFRVLRALKNRFGATDEIGLFEMTGEGLIGIPDPSQMFLAERDRNLPGSSVCAVLEGTRVVMCEVQALVRDSNSPMPIRQVSGIDPKRLSMLMAVLSRSGYKVGGKDVFVSVIGGLKVTEPAIDLAVCLAVASADKRRVVKEDVAAFGEVTLQGKVRKASQNSRRAKEAQRLSYETLGIAGTLREVLERGLGESYEDPGMVDEEAAVAA